mmetsp:Transcript_21058/g.59195  ORF Transcript_21058/g.59195 Transcript_21058/m.59195 type:complete len:246 (-) Transcript_21058:177-914(-)
MFCNASPGTAVAGGAASALAPGLLGRVSVAIAAMAAAAAAAAEVAGGAGSGDAPEATWLSPLDAFGGLASTMPCNFNSDCLQVSRFPATFPEPDMRGAPVASATMCMAGADALRSAPGRLLRGLPSCGPPAPAADVGWRLHGDAPSLGSERIRDTTPPRSSGPALSPLPCAGSSWAAPAGASARGAAGASSEFRVSPTLIGSCWRHCINACSKFSFSRSRFSISDDRAGMSDTAPDLQGEPSSEP